MFLLIRNCENLTKTFPVSPKGRDCTDAASLQIGKLLQHSVIPRETIINALELLRKPIKDAQRILEFVKTCKEGERVKFFELDLSKTIGVLHYLIWSF